MKQELEQYLWDRLPADGYDPANTARDIINDMIDKGMIQNYKQGLRTLYKWEKQNKWEWGVNVDLGWKITK